MKYLFTVAILFFVVATSSRSRIPGEILSGVLEDDGTEASFLIKKILHRSSQINKSRSFRSKRQSSLLERSEESFLLELESPALKGFDTKRRLGQGGMGAVYLVEDTRTGDTFAAKVSTTGRDDLKKEYKITQLAYDTLSQENNLGAGVIGPVRSLKDESDDSRIMLMPLYV